MKKNILKVDYSKLRKAEIKTFASRVIKIVEKHNPETLKINEIFDLLVELEPQIDSLQFGYGPHPITLSLNALRRKRNAFAKGIISRIETLENAEVRGMQEALMLTKPIVLRHLKSLYSFDETTIYQKIVVFFDLVDKDEELETALSTLELTAYLNDLRNVNSSIEEQFINRSENISARPKLKTPTIVASLKVAFLDLYKQIEVAHIKNKELDYTSLIDELNEQIAILKATLKARASYNKKKAEGVIDDNEVVIDDESTEPITTTASNMRIYPMNEEVEEKMGDLDDVDKKKTVAVSSITTQLPTVPTKA